MDQENIIPDASTEGGSEGSSEGSTEDTSFKKAVGNAAPADDKSIQEDNEEGKTSDEEKTSEEDTESSPDDKGQQHDYEQRHKDTQSALSKKSEEYQRVIDSNAKLVESSPELLDQISETDSQLADEISHKLHGQDYQGFKKDQELEEKKESDPEGYETESRIRKLEKREAKARKATEDAFFTGKEISTNELDPANKKVREQLNALNPSFVEDNLDKSLEIAYNLAFPSKEADSKAAEEEKDKASHLAKNTSGKGGNVQSSPGHEGSEKKLSPAAQGFRNTMRDLTGK